MTSPLPSLTDGMPAHFTMPQELLDLAAWCAAQGWVSDGYAFLAEPDAHPDVMLGAGERIGWDGYLAAPDRLWEVATTGADGSTLCLWLDDDGKQHLVHHGSEGFAFVFPSILAALRLLAVGYEEPACNEEWADEPEDDTSALDPYRAWLVERFGTTIPATGLEALGVEDDPETWTGDGPRDAFAAWLGADGTLV